jgi:hypothetical protein
VISNEAVEAAAEVFDRIVGIRDLEAARKILEAAAPHLLAAAAVTIKQFMEAWAGDKELGFLEGFAEAAQEEARRSAEAGA